MVLKRRYLRLYFTVFALLVNFIFARSASAFSPETHAWVAQQVLDDANDDGAVRIGGRDYMLDPALEEALRDCGAYYRMGNIGPDVFPDPVVGQMTAHPGLEGGWKTDDFLKHLLRRASTKEELAFAYGYVGHAAGDVFSHTYVNHYAGDIFDLQDGEFEVELRHCKLEKFVAQHTPPYPQGQTDFDVPADFLRDTLILNDDIFEQYEKTGETASHMTSIYKAHRAVAKAKSEAEEIREQIRGIQEDFSTAILKQAQIVVPFQLEVTLARQGLDAAKGLLEEKDKAVTDLQKEIVKADKRIEQFRKKIDKYRKYVDIIDKAPGIISGLEHSISEAEGKLVSDEKKLERLRNGLLKRVLKEIEKVADCDDLPSVLGGKAKKKCRDLKGLHGQINGLKDTITGYGTDLSNWRGKESVAKLNELKALKDKLEADAEILIEEGFKKKHKAEKAEAERERDFQRDMVGQAEKRLETAEALLKEPLEILNDLKRKHDAIFNAFLKMEFITQGLHKWLSDIERAAAEYIEVSRSAGIIFVKREGDAAELYEEWLKCWGPAFLMPAEISQATCAVNEAYESFDEEINKVVDDLGPLGFLVAPVPKLKSLKEMLDKEVKREVVEAGLEVLRYCREDLAELITFFYKNEPVTESGLNEVFSHVDAGNRKKLLLIDDVADRVKFDMHLSSEDDCKFSPDKFYTARNAVTLAKLSLLEPAQLNKLFTDNTDSADPTIYGLTLYPLETENRFTLLFDAIRSIDGNHQWQHTALPYPRQCGSFDEGWPHRREYGYSKCQDGKGFRLYSDPVAREDIFRKIFKGPMNPGFSGHDNISSDCHSFSNLNRHSDMLWGCYPFPTCEENPFPSAEFDDGTVKPYGDYYCASFFWRISNIYRDRLIEEAENEGCEKD